MSRCRTCDAPIIWAYSENGWRIPLDLAPYRGADPRGLFVLRENGEVAVAAPADAFPDEPHYRAHFVTCPDRDEWRKRR